MHGIGRRAAAFVLALAVLAGVSGGTQAAASPTPQITALGSSPDVPETLPNGLPPMDWWW